METETLARTFVSLADTLVDDFDVFDVLHTLTSQCVDLLGASAVGLLLADEQEQLRVTTASSDSARLLDLFQIQNDEGPCLDCYRSGQPVNTERLDTAGSRWPRFATAATDAGFTTVLALPMRLRGQTIGALNIFGDTQASPISAAEVPVAQSLADVATIAILQDRLARDRDLLNEQLQEALNSRITIEQAKGTLAERLDIGTDEAFDRLRRHARTSRRRLVDVAAEVSDTDVDWASAEPRDPDSRTP